MPREERQTLEEMHHPEEIRRRLREPARSSSLPDAILDGIDGYVTTFAVVSGAFGAGFSSTVALVLGLANLLADGFSMAIDRKSTRLNSSQVLISYAVFCSKTQT